ncbi:hypothetical protein J437_LFUL017555 [Ladona fulva]|uniref:Cytochrome b5 heme-binding domain-containing protein n=1 Tax=Ladona fulva TaxID=123851 RepID=A0A8K0KLR1_LADFU|nr:hypothetical protein J437_LFUL017555 [Ladona fulva]
MKTMTTTLQQTTLRVPATIDSGNDSPVASASSVGASLNLLPPQPSSGAGGAAAAGPVPPSDRSTSSTLSTSPSGVSLSGTGTEIRSSNSSSSDFRLPVITLEEVSWHDTNQDCWIVINDRVYDVTPFLYEHPGGEDILLENAGRDASFAFSGAGHSAAAIRALDRYIVGILPESERIFQSPSRESSGNRKFGLFFF